MVVNRVFPGFTLSPERVILSLTLPLIIVLTNLVCAMFPQRIRNRIWTITIKQHLIYQNNVTNQILKYMMYCPIETSVTLILVSLKILLFVYTKKMDCGMSRKFRQ